MYSNEIIIAFIETDLPDPVVPAINKCGILAKSVTIGFPAISFPKAREIPSFLRKSKEERISFKNTFSIFLFGNSIPMAFLP